MTRILADVFNLSGLVAFCAGIAATRAYYWARDKWMDYSHPNEPHHQHRWKSIVMAWAFLGVVLLYEVGQTHEAYVLTQRNTADVQGLTAQTRGCQKVILESVRARAELTDTADQLVEELRNQLALSNTELNTWIEQLLNPPANIAALPIGDLKRQQYGLDITTAYFAQSDVVQKRIANLQEQISTFHDERKKHPFESPQCGG